MANKHIFMPHRKHCVC